MLKQFIQIEGVGIFDKLKLEGNTQLKKSNIIYGENGSGKTTLCSILRSLRDNKPNIIKQRKNIKKDNQYIELLLNENKKCKFKHKEWYQEKDINGIYIFDSFFISENIYSGFDFSSDHRKNLHNFVLGEKGAEIAKVIENVKNSIQDEREEIKELKRKIKDKIKPDKYDGKINIDELKDLEKNHKIDKEIEEAKEKLQRALKEKEIKEKDNFDKLNKITFPFNIVDLKTILGYTVNSISEDYVKQFDKYKQYLIQNNLEDSENWLEKGLNYVEYKKDKEEIELAKVKCPFCHQLLDNAEDVIKSYAQYFNHNYKNHKKEIQVLNKNLKNYKLEVILSDLQTNIEKNIKKFEFWKSYLDNNKLSIKNSDLKIEINNEIISIHNKIKEQLEFKKREPLKEVESKNVEIFERQINLINKKIEDYNNAIGKLKKEVKEIKREILDIESIKTDLNKLFIHKKRFETDIKNLFNNLELKELVLYHLNFLKNRKQEKLGQYSTDIFNKYGEKINEYLHDFAPSTDFEIIDIDSRYRGRSKKPYAEYSLTLKGQKLSLNNKATIPNVKTSLSEGDKRTLAFAFFLAKLDLDSNLSKKIVVLDDPVSSFDLSRRYKTVRKIKWLNQEAKQIIVTTHDLELVFTLFETLSNPSVLKLDYSKCLKEYDNIKIDMELDYFKNIRDIYSFLEDPKESEKVEMIRKIRLVLEDGIKFRFYSELKINNESSNLGPLSSNDGLGKVIDILEETNCELKGKKENVIRKLRDLNDFSCSYCHGEIDRSHRVNNISMEEVISNLKTTLTVLKEKL